MSDYEADALTIGRDEPILDSWDGGPISKAKRPQRRLGAENSETRAKLIEAAAQLLQSEGSGAVTARRLADMVGLQRHIVHYYFGTIEDLLVAVFRRDRERTRAWMKNAPPSDDPLRAIWDMASRAAAGILEFSALAARHAAIREEFKNTSEEFRRNLTEIVTQYCKVQGLTPRVPPEAVTIALQSIAYTISVERLLGMNEGHDVMMASLDRLLGVPLD